MELHSIFAHISNSPFYAIYLMRFSELAETERDGTELQSALVMKYDETSCRIQQTVVVISGPRPQDVGPLPYLGTCFCSAFARPLLQRGCLAPEIESDAKKRALPFLKVSRLEPKYGCPTAY